MRSKNIPHTNLIHITENRQNIATMINARFMVEKERFSGLTFAQLFVGNIYRPTALTLMHRAENEGFPYGQHYKSHRYVFMHCLGKKATSCYLQAHIMGYFGMLIKNNIP